MLHNALVHVQAALTLVHMLQAATPALVPELPGVLADLDEQHKNALVHEHELHAVALTLENEHSTDYTPPPFSLPTCML